ncbi:hypothetical protein [[Phormidium] sp. ETS-05]|nr:hypothetical protein [[Phormidium] sp. ETS-05]
MRIAVTGNLTQLAKYCSPTADRLYGGTCSDSGRKTPQPIGRTC